MKYFELDASEESLLHDFESGELKTVSQIDDAKAQYREYVAAMLKKGKNINIRLSEHDLLRIKAKALAEGIPYQTYVASLVHKNLQA